MKNVFVKKFFFLVKNFFLMESKFPLKQQKEGKFCEKKKNKIKKK